MQWSEMKPLAIDLFCGLGGWSDGLLAEGWDVFGFDIEQHVYGDHRYPAQLVVQDVLTLHGSQFRNADLIVASPPCQEYSYMAMPWKKAKAKAAAIRADDTGAELERLNRLFNACFRIQMEACIAAGRHIPMIVENVRGAQPWVGRARWMFGSFALWGDVPALMPITSKGVKVGMPSWRHPDDPRHVPGLGFNTHADRNLRDGRNPDGRKLPGFRFDGSGASFQSRSVEGLKLKDQDGYEREHPNAFGWKAPRTSSQGSARKMASAMIAKIPLALSRYIAATFHP
jgi:C-5 cytosine-specific DNA methylase